MAGREELYLKHIDENTGRIVLYVPGPDTTRDMLYLRQYYACRLYGGR